MNDERKQQGQGSANFVEKHKYIVFGLVFVFILGVGYVLFGGSDDGTPSSSVGGTPAIESLPGVGDPSVEYAKLIAEQNKAQAQEAERAGESSLPTLIKPQYSLDAQSFTDKIEGSKIKRDENRCSPENLKNAREAGVKASELRCYGCTLEELLAAGYSAADLLAAGFSVAELMQAGVSGKALLDAGVSVSDLRAAGFTAAELLASGVSVHALIDAGFTPQQLLSSGVAIQELRSAGVSLQEILASGARPGTIVDGGYCARGVYLGLDEKSQIRSGGVKAEDLYDGGVPVSELLKLGYSIQEVAIAGVTPAQFLAAGASAQELISAGFSKRDVTFAEKNRAQIKGGVCTPQYVESQMAVGVTAKVLINLGCSPKVMADEGYKARDLVEQGVTAGQMRVIGFSASDLVALGIQLEDLIDACYDAASLLEAGFSPSELVRAGIPIQALLDAGLTARELKQDGVDCVDLYQAGIPVEDLFMMGCDAQTLRAAGASVSELLTAGYSVAELKRAGFELSELLAAGVDPSDLLAAGYTVDQLLLSGVTKGDLVRAGVNPDDIYTSSSSERSSAGCDPRQIQEMLDEGVTVKEILDDGCSIQALLDAGVSVSELLDAGVSARQLIASGVSAKDLYLAGVDVTDLKGLFTNIELQDAGYMVEQSDDFSTDAIMSAGTSQAMTNEEILAQQEREAKIIKLASAMQAQASSLFAQWDVKPMQSLNSGAKSPKDYGMTSSQASSAGQMDSRVQMSRGYLKAGSMMYAVLDNDITSSDPTPVLATISNGPLKGSKLLGEFQQDDTKLVLKFERINSPGVERSRDIAVFAVDVNTASNVEIESHYLLKYGSLFAASFLSGLNDVAKNIGKQVSTSSSSNGTTTTVSEGGTINQSKILAAGLGKVGENLVTQVEQFQDLEPTIRMRSGAVFGILLMDDYEVQTN